ncbi:MAG: tail fiber domain-containing protein [Verrucomicrobia bacterium]|nr:tail fiber domain-containing protein [Verrucomicrobiota bacterium]
MNTRNAPTHRWPTLVAAAVILTLIAFLSSPPTYGQANQFPPGKMTFQGFLTDASSPPVPLGNTTPENKSVIFKIYKSANGTASTDVAWAETQVVTVDKGHFSVLLGEGSAVSGFPHDTDLSGVFIGSDASDRWIGITVDSAEITPRIQFFAAPYAQLARTANTLASGAVLSGNVQIGTLSDPKVTLEFGAGKSGKDGAAGKIGYETFTAGALDIVGAGGNPRTIKLWDNVIIPGSATISGAATVGATTVNGSLTSSGSVAGLIFQNRDSSSVWQWYSTGGTARLWNGGDKITVSSAGVIGSAGLTVSGKNIIELGIGLAKESNAGKIGYQVFTDALDIVGAGTSGSGRKIRLWGDVVVGGKPTWGKGPENGNLTVTGTAALGATTVTGVLVATSFKTFSDARIKSLVGLSDSRVDLETIQKLRVTDYRMVDEVAEGDAIKKGFIAQEVEAVIPEAVSWSRQFVPDIYSNPSSFHFDPRRRELSLTLAKPHGLKTGDRVRIIADESQLELSVTEVPSAAEFIVGNVEKAPKQVFVYGKQVPDFRALNYDRIFTTGIGAIQELARRVEELKKSEARIAELEQKTSRMAELEQKAARVDTLEREMAQLKKLVAGLAEAQAPKQVAGIQNISTVAVR